LSLTSARKAETIARIAAVAIFAYCAPLALADAITLSTTAPTVGFGPSFPINTGGPSFTYTPSSSAGIALGSTPLILDTSTQNFGEYTFSSSPLAANTLTVTLQVTPAVNGTTDTAPLVFNGTLETGLHIITQPTPYLIDFDPALNPSAELILYGGHDILALPFDGDLFGVEVFNGLSTPASTNSTVAPVLGFIAPESSIPEPGSMLTVGIGLACLIGFWFFRRRLSAST
jgi:hypothetical protein